MKKILSVVVLSLSVIFLSACAGNISPNTYSPSSVGVASDAVPGVIIGKRRVNIDNNSGLGGPVGAVAGGVAGSTIGGSPVANILGAVGGAVVGGLAGNAIDKSANSHIGFEYIIKVGKGHTISVTQASDIDLMIGERVMVIYGPQTRVVPDNTLQGLK